MCGLEFEKNTFGILEIENRLWNAFCRVEPVRSIQHIFDRARHYALR
jgi:hypothetical protein